MSEATSSTLAAASTQASGAQATDSASVSTHGPSHPGETAATGELEAGRASNARDEPIPARPTGARQVASDPTSVSTLSRTRSRSAALLTSLLTGSPSVATSSSTSISSVTPCVPTFAQGGPDSPSPITRRQSHASTDESGQVVKDAGWRMPTWGSPMRKENKCAAKGVERSTASQSDDLGLALGLRVDKASPRRSEDGENANAFIDEGISMAEVPGRVDFLTSLPLEISLYVLLFADVRSLCRALQVSKNWLAICSDATLWREHFYRNPGWRIRPDYLDQARKPGIDSSSLSFSTPTRTKRSATAVGDSSIASRIGRRIGDLVNGVGYLTLYNRSPDGRGRTLSTSTVAEAVQASPIAHRTRSSTSASQAAPHAHESHGISQPQRQLAGLPAATRSRNNTTASVDDTFSRTPGRNRSASTGTMSPFHEVTTPLAEEEQGLVSAIDWKNLYRDRSELERRWGAAEFCTKTLKGHEDSVYCVCLHDDVLLSGSRDKTIKVWNSRTGDLQRTITAHNASVLAIQYDGTTMVTGASNGELFIWDIAQWIVSSTLTGHTAGVLDVQMNEAWIASCSKDTSVRLWKRSTTDPYRVLQGHRGPVNAIQLWQNTIVSASGDAIAKLWDIETGQVLRVFNGHERGLACVQYNGEVLMTGSNDQTIRVWDPSTGQCTKILKGHKDLVRTLAYDPLRKRLFSGSYDKSTRLWDLESGNLQITLTTSHKSLVFDVNLDVSRAVSCSHDKRLVIIDFGEGLDAQRFL